MIHYIWPIALVVLANVVYNISTKSTPAGANAFLSLAVTYLIAGICAILLYLLQGGHQKFTAELSKLNWTSIALGISVVALEFGYIHVYRAGWTVNTASLVANIARLWQILPLPAYWFSWAFSCTKKVSRSGSSSA